MKKIIVLTVIFALGAACWHLVHALYIQQKAELAQGLLEKAWDKTMRKHQALTTSLVKPAVMIQEKPWSWSDSWPIARLSFPSHDRDLIVLNHGTGRSLAFAPSHIAGSAQPGQPGVSVIGGHKDTHFEFLQDIELAEDFWLELPSGERYLYRVRGIEIADVTRSRLSLESEKSLIALVACYPFGLEEANGSLRYLVIGEPSVVDFPI